MLGCDEKEENSRIMKNPPFEIQFEKDGTSPFKQKKKMLSKNKKQKSL